MGKLRRVALLMEREIGYCRGVLRGIHTYAIHKTDWIFRDAAPQPEIIGPLREWQPDGVIARLYDRSFARRVIALQKPLVNITSTFLDLNVPLTEVDNEKVGCLAAEHFLERGFKTFGYFGSSWAGFSKQREWGFRDTLRKNGFTVSSCYAEYLPRLLLNASWKREERQIHEWLLALEKPAAILASTDVPARRLAEMCRQLRLRVPEDIALLGVDNDELECLLANPPLSSIANPAEQIGYTAAQLLDQLMSGRRPRKQTIWIPPGDVVVRQSTDIVAFGDADVAAALQFIRDHLAEDITVAAIARHVSISRRGLERRFRHHLGRTMLQEIQRARVERVRRLLAETDLPMLLVARRSGFATSQRLAVVFRQVCGDSPTAFRQRTRLRT
ncbi:MAG: DNA-binding transcriptional regulator [Thermoguttaceae bacterium]